MTTYKSDIVLGERYTDSQTGFEGVATAVYFFQYGCERVEVQTMDATTQEIRTNCFDSPRLVHVKSGKVPKVARTGGPGSSTEGRAAISGRASIAAR